MRVNESSQSTVIGDDKPPATPHKGKAPEPELPLAFGKDVLNEFSFDPDYRNLNHASFGSIPSFIQQKLFHYQSLYERRPDQFIRYTYPELLDSNRAAIAALLNAPSVDEVVFVPNATVGVNTVLRALSETWNADGRDEILHFSTIYGSCGKTIDYVTDSTYGRVRGRDIALTYPLSDAAILSAFHAAVSRARSEGRRPRVAVFDTVSSLPGARFPYEVLVRACRELGILSLVDAAQGVGIIPLDLAALDPDFLVSNLHKWLFVPRACAVFYVPVRNQGLIRSTVPTSHGYVPRDAARARANPLPPSGKSAFVSNFEYVGTLDNAAYLCTKDAIEWRERVLGGEERIRAYLWRLAAEGGQRVADRVGTWVMQNEEKTLGDCGMVNVALPLVVVDDNDGSGAEPESIVQEKSQEREADVEEAAPVKSLQNETTEATGQSLREGETEMPRKEAQRIWEWMTRVLVDEYQTFIPVFYHAGRFWVRLSAQVYLDTDDFEWAGKTLKELCERVARKEYDL